MSARAASDDTFHVHVRELRRRLAWVALALSLGAAVGYVYRVAVINFLQRPLHLPLYYSSPAGSFNFVMKNCMFAGIVVALPVILYNLIKFIEPAFEKKVSWKMVATLVFCSLGLAVAGCAFAYFIVVPMSLHFFAGYNTPTIHPLIQASDYFNFLIKCLISFAIIFQLPLLMLFINFINPMNPRRLIHYERHVVIAALVIALILPFTYDPITQFVIAIPIIALYNLSILFVWMGGRYRKQQAGLSTKTHTATRRRSAKQPTPTRTFPVARPRYPSPHVIDLSGFRATDPRS